MKFALNTDEGVFVTMKLEEVDSMNANLHLYGQLLLFLQQENYDDNLLLKQYIIECTENYNKMYELLHKNK